MHDDLLRDIQRRLYDTQLRLWRVEQKFDSLLEQDKDDARIVKLTKVLNASSAALDAAVDAASKVIPPPVA